MPLDGISSFDSRLKADWNCLLQISDLSKVSVFKIPFFLRVLIPDASFLRDMTNDQNVLPFHLRGQSASGLSFSKEKILVTCFQYASLMLF